MATTKLPDFITALQFAATTDTMLSIGLAPDLVKVLVDLLVTHDQPSTPMRSPGELLARCHLSANTDTPVNVSIGPSLAAQIIALDERLQQTEPKLINADARITNLSNELATMNQMRMYINYRLPKLNPARGHNEASDRAIDDICRAIAAANDPDIDLCDPA